MKKYTNRNFHLIGENPVLYDAEMNPIDPKSENKVVAYMSTRVSNKVPDGTTLYEAYKPSSFA